MGVRCVSVAYHENEVSFYNDRAPVKSNHARIPQNSYEHIGNIDLRKYPLKRRESLSDEELLEVEKFIFNKFGRGNYFVALDEHGTERFPCIRVLRDLSDIPIQHESVTKKTSTQVA